MDHGPPRGFLVAFHGEGDPRVTVTRSNQIRVPVPPADPRARLWRGCPVADATLRLADGPDEVHRNQIGQIELRKHR